MMSAGTILVIGVFVSFTTVVGLLAYFGVIAPFLHVRRARWFKEEYEDVLTAEPFEEPEHVHAVARARCNPILAPRGDGFEACAAMNPAAVLDGDTVHMFYRAIGADGISRVGYAWSQNGIDFERLDQPVFSHVLYPPRKGCRYDPGQYGSGGSYCGAEDPRATIIGERVYITYNAFNGWDALRVAMTSIALKDLRARRFRFSSPVYLSPAGERHKNWAWFPEKVHDEYMLFHNLNASHPTKVDEPCGCHATSEMFCRTRVSVASVDDIATCTSSTLHVQSPDPNALKDAPLAWHRRVRGIAAPPLKTERGWLVLYHAMDADDPSHYKLGAMLLDANDPERVIARACRPVLEPKAWYENEGAKAGVVYACGAVIKDGMLMVYYGGADSVTCVAAADANAFIQNLCDGTQPRLDVQGGTQCEGPCASL